MKLTKLENPIWVIEEHSKPTIRKDCVKTDLPLYVVLEDGNFSLAEYTKTEIRDGQEWACVDYKPIWICRDKNSEYFNKEVSVKKWLKAFYLSENIEG